MLDNKTKDELKAKLYPTANQIVFGPIIGALNQNVNEDARVLDAGCGKGTWILRDYREKIGLLVGVDSVIPQGKTFDRLIVCDIERLPLLDKTFDVIVCYCVIEHLRHPENAFREFWRVLNNGGVLILKTPSITAPIFLLSRYISFHRQKRIKETIQGTRETDIFPTYYRCNTATKLDRSLRNVGFHRETLEEIDQVYDYLVFSKIAYAAGLIASRLLQLLPWAKTCRSQIIGSYRKPANNNLETQKKE